MSASSTASQHSLPLTFGIEIEHLLAFHSSMLSLHIHPDTRIIKHLSKDTRTAMRQVSNQYSPSRPSYLGWALAAPSDYPSTRGHDWRNQCFRAHGCRGYADEILNMEAKILREQGLDVIVHDCEGTIADYDSWHLTTDTSLVSATPEELADVIGVRKTGTGEWDSAPLELVSRVLRIDDPASYEEIGRFLAALNPMPQHPPHESLFQAFGNENKWCGLHVHIGLPPPSPSSSSSPSPSSSSSPSDQEQQQTFPLALLQHLAYITIIYEPILSRLHPARRRPGNRDTDMDLGCCRSAFYEEPECDFSDDDDDGWSAVDVDDATTITTSKEEEEEEGGEEDSWYFCTAWEGASSSSLKAQDAEWSDDDSNDYASSPSSSFISLNPPSPSPPPPSDDEKADRAFEEQLRKIALAKIFAPDMTLQRLINLMSENQKGRVVNWTYLSRSHSCEEDGGEGDWGPRTIEFRQHEGCVDPVEIGMWVRFLGGLVRWAGRMAEVYGDIGGYGWGYGEGEVLGVETLVEGMGEELGEGGREWVRRRWEMWR
ncbi:MAG: hypothetical protein LQ350_004241 [Teloschistes chrysophthalmus]|nr:MAG: hypothetical protein LQ350_004241 [Niorma chrysophthalma]